MKAYLQYNVYYEVELPNIGSNTLPYRQAVTDLRKYVESELLDDNWIVEFLGVIED